MSGGGQPKNAAIPKELRGGYKNLGQEANSLINYSGKRGTYLGLSNQRRMDDLKGVLDRTGNPGVENSVLNRTFDTGGYTGFTSDDLTAFDAARNLRGSDSALGTAINRFKNNDGVDALRGINVGRNQNQALEGLENFNSDQLRGFTPGALKGYQTKNLNGLDFNQLQQTASGKFLDVANNPFLSDALANAQRQTTEAFQRDVQPALAAQFGGGFGLTGSSSINAQRRAAEDVGRTLGEQATATYADQYNRERGFQESARSQLGQLGLSRAQSQDQLGFNRASQLSDLGFNRASQIDQNQLSRGGQLGQLGLGFTNAEIGRGTNLANSQLQQAQGIAQVGNDRRQQELQRIGVLNNIGQQQRQSAQDLFNAQRGRYDEQVNGRINQLQGIGGILGGIPTGGGGTAGGGGSRAAGIIGGIGTGAGLGASVGGPFGGLIGGIGGGILGAF